MNESSLKQRKIEITNNDNESNANDYLDESKYKKFDDKQQQIESLFSQSILFASNQSNSSDDTSSSSMTIENFLWFLASIVLIYFTDIFNVILYNTTIYRSLMMIGFGLISINVGIAFYLVVWLSFVKKINSDKWGELHPTYIPIATACFVAGSLLLTIAIWPVYSFLSAPILFTIFMGFIVVIINLPLW